MKKLRILSASLFLSVFLNAGFSQQIDQAYILPGSVITELNRLNEAYQMLDQFSAAVWPGWNDYMTYPFLFTFQNGLRVLVGHPSPPSVFVPYPDITVRGLRINIDTTELNDFTISQPFDAGGGPLTMGSFNNKPVTIVDIRLAAHVSDQPDTGFHAENNILTYIHELMHCYQPKFLKVQYGNLRINPDLNMALYSDIEGRALLKAYEQDTYDKSLPFIKDFCIAHSLKVRDLSTSEKNSYSADEFREGEAVYSEVTILGEIGRGFRSSLSTGDDPSYTQFSGIDKYLGRYRENLRNSTGNTLEIYGKNYWYGCFKALLLQKYYPGWQKEIEDGRWPDQIFREKTAISPSDSLADLQRFQVIYGIDSLKSKHEAVITERDEAYRAFKNRKGRVYIIDMKPVIQTAMTTVAKNRKNYHLGLMYMYPEGLGNMKFNDVSLEFKSVPAEINELYYIKIVDTHPRKSGRHYRIRYGSAEAGGIYNDVTITTPLFILKAPKISVIETSGRTKFRILART